MAKKKLIEEHKALFSDSWIKELQELEAYSLKHGSDKNSINCYYDGSKYFAKMILLRLAQSFGTNGRIYNGGNIKKVLPGISAAFGPKCIDTIIRPCLAEKKPLIYVDHPYFGNDYNRPGIFGQSYEDNDIYSLQFRMVFNSPHQTGILKYPDDRFKKFKIELKNWNKSGSHILVCPPSGRMDDLLNVTNKWLFKTAKTIRKNSDRKIIIRPKPSTTPPKEWFKLEKTISNLSIRTHCKYTNIQDDLKDCWAVVAPASNISIEAIIAGIPVFCDNTSPTKEIGLQDYSKIENPIYPDRLPLLNSLAYCQFSINEVISGFAKLILEKNMKLN